MKMKGVHLFLLLAAFLIFAGAEIFASEEAFLAGLEEVRSLVERRQYSSAKRGLDTLLAKHINRDYVRAKRTEIEASHKTCSFRSSYSDPKWKTLVSGKLISFNPGTGSMEIRYDPTNLDDFISTGEKGFLLHPAVFKSDYTIELKGKLYSTKPMMVVYVCCEEENAYSVFPGVMSSMFSMAAGISKYSPDSPGPLKWQAVAEEEKPPLEQGDPFQLKIKVTNTKITLYSKNRSYLHCKKARGLFGQVGICNELPRDCQIVIKGKIHAAWLEGLKSRKEQAAREAFEKEYVASDHLPDWLYEKSATGTAASGEPDRSAGGKVAPAGGEAAPAGGEAAPAGGEDPGYGATKTYPGPDYPVQNIHLNKAISLHNEGRSQEGLDYVMALNPGDTTQEVCLFLTAVFLMDLEDYEKALPLFRQVRAMDPAFVEALQVQAYLETMLRQWDNAILSFQALLEKQPKEAAHYEALAMLLLNKGEPDQAKAIIDQALARGVNPASLEATNEQLVMAFNGPDFRKRYQKESKHYHVVTDISDSRCREVSKVLEESFKAFKNDLQKVDDPPALFRAFLFSGEAGYLNYCRNIKSETMIHTAGLYSPTLKQLLIWNLPDKEDMLRTVRHEGFHQYLDCLMDDPPIWFNEGLAEYYEIADYIYLGTRIKGGQIPANHMRTLTSNVKLSQKGQSLSLAPLSTFLYMTPEAFYKNPQIHYAQAWAMIHFLRHSTARNEALFRTLFSTLQQDIPSPEALDQVFRGMDIAQLEQDFMTHLKSLAQDQ